MRVRASQATASLRDVLRNPSIRRIELSWTAGAAADWAFLVVLLVFVYDAGGALAVGILGAVRIIPAIGAAPFAPMLVERYRGDRVLTEIGLHLSITGGFVWCRRQVASLRHAVYVAEWGRERREQARSRSHAERLASRDGYFAPESVIRRVGNSPLVPLLGGGAAVLLQVAHPLVAAGVTEHSDYRRDLWRRLLRTLNALYFIVYGSKDEADRAGEAVQKTHRRVQGSTTCRLGPFPAGTPYSAAEPELMLWVHGTLVQVSLSLYCNFVGRLSPEQKDAYYREMSLVARIFGTPEGVIPRSFRDFRGYFGERIASPEICVTEPARDVAEVILRASSLPFPLRMIAPAHRLSTSALLPPRLREEYGLGWNGKRALALRGGARSIKLAAAPVLMVTARVSPTRLALPS